MDRRFATLITSSLAATSKTHGAVNACPAVAWLDPGKYYEHVGAAIAAAKASGEFNESVIAGAEAALSEALDAR